MKGLISRILTKEKNIAEYAAILPRNGPEEKVFASFDGVRLDITERHWLLSLEPMVIGIWMGQELQETYLEGLDLSICIRKYKGDWGPAATMHLRSSGQVQDSQGVLGLFEVVDAQPKQFSRSRVWLHYLVHYRKKNIDFLRFRYLVAGFSFPRPVRLVSAGGREDPNIFPMDYVGILPAENRFVFGLRHSNRSMPSILSSRNLVVSEVPGVYKDRIYALGNNHRTKPRFEEMGLGTIRSHVLAFDLPDWAEQYWEIKVLETVDLGSHRLIWGESIGHTVLKEPTLPLCHIHFLHYLCRLQNSTTYERIL